MAENSLKTAPLRTAIDSSLSLLSSAINSFSNYNATTGSIVKTVQDKTSQVTAQPWATNLTNKVTNTVNPLIDQADQKLAPLIEGASKRQKTALAYSKEVIDNAQDTASANFKTALEKTQDALRSLQAMLAKYSEQLEARVPYSAELRARLSALIVAAVELSNQGRQFVDEKIEKPARKLLHSRLEFVATELETRIVKGDANATGDVESLLGRVKGLVAAASEAAATGIRKVAKAVEVQGTPMEVEEEKPAPAKAEPKAEPAQSKKGKRKNP